MVSKMNTFVLVRLLSLAFFFQFCWFKFLKRALSISFCTFVPPCLNFVLNLFTPFVSLPLFAHVQASKMFLLGSGRIDWFLPGPALQPPPRTASHASTHAHTRMHTHSLGTLSSVQICMNVFLSWIEARSSSWRSEEAFQWITWWFDVTEQ